MRTANPMRKECPYEVGDILQTKNATPPSTRWPGTTWKAITTMLLGASTAHPVGSTGGEETHKLTIGELPLKTRNLLISTGLIGGGAWDKTTETDSDGNVTSITANPTATTAKAYYTVATSNSDFAAHNNMPPYTAVYIWERTS